VDSGRTCLAAVSGLHNKTLKLTGAAITVLRYVKVLLAAPAA
jgi:hypothetical protein